MGLTEQFLANYLTQDQGEICIRQLTIQKDGELSDWPDGFFDQKQRDLRDLFYLRIADGNNE